MTYGGQGVGRPLTYGEQAVGLTFNPSGDERVHLLKQHFAAAIDLLYKEMDGTAPLSSEQRRLYGTAITEAQTAQMWAVKAVTFRG